MLCILSLRLLFSVNGCDIILSSALHCQLPLVRCVLMLHALQFGKNGDEHDDEAEASADNIGNGFSHKDTVWPHIQSIRQNIGQRNDNDDLTQYREKDSKFLFVKGFKYGLADILQQHKDKCGKVKLHSRDGICHQCLVRAENTD